MPMVSNPITRRAVMQAGMVLIGSATLPTLAQTAFAQGRSLSPAPNSASPDTGRGRNGIFLMNRIAPSSSDLYISNADGSGERKFLEAPAFDYNASFAADGQERCVHVRAQW